MKYPQTGAFAIFPFLLLPVMPLLLGDGEFRLGEFRGDCLLGEFRESRGDLCRPGPPCLGEFLGDLRGD